MGGADVEKEGGCRGRMRGVQGEASVRVISSDAVGEAGVAGRR